MIFIYVYLYFIYLLYFDIFVIILLNFALLTGCPLRPVLLSNTVHTEIQKVLLHIIIIMIKYINSGINLLY